MGQTGGDLHQGQKLLILGTALAFQLSQGRSGQELAELSAILKVVSDQLGLLALYLPGEGAGGCGAPHPPAEAL